jgi:ABC-2 type transport system ATP-binding protein
VAVINHGRIIALDTPAALKQHVRDLSVIEIEAFGVPSKLIEQLRALPFVDTVTVENRDQKQALMIQSPRGSEAVPDLMGKLNGLRVGRVIVREPTLEDAYVRLVGGEG